MSLQKTIDQPVEISGPGLFSSQQCTLRFVPAEVDSGIVFVRKLGDSHDVKIPCDIANLADRPRRTTLTNGGATVETVEHVLSAVAGLQIDNLIIELDGEEVPSNDSSALPFAEALQKAGIREQDSQRQVLVIKEPVSVSNDQASLTALPGETDCLEIIYELDYGPDSSIGKQVHSFCLGRDDYAAEIAPARTFLPKNEAEQFRSEGIGTHLTTKDIVIMDDNGIVDNELRYEDELVRHKLADLIGDLALVGRPLAGRIIASRSGHKLNHALARRLKKTLNNTNNKNQTRKKEAMDIQKIMRILPHRYPFLLIDRVTELDEDHAVAIKNVSINEPFFQGHYPSRPIMPGVLILEAMAQLSGLLLSPQLQKSGKVAVLLSIDRAKMRRPVRPGDQLILEASLVRVRNQTGHCRCHASVENEPAAEAEIKFMLVDPESV